MRPCWPQLAAIFSSSLTFAVNKFWKISVLISILYCTAFNICRFVSLLWGAFVYDCKRLKFFWAEKPPERFNRYSNELLSSYNSFSNLERQNFSVGSTTFWRQKTHQSWTMITNSQRQKIRHEKSLWIIHPTIQVQKIKLVKRKTHGHFDWRAQVMTGDVISRCHTSQRSTIVFVQNAS